MLRIVTVHDEAQFQGTPEELENVRQGGIFSVDLNGIKCEMRCDPNYTNVTFKPLEKTKELLG